ncbi:MAG: hypothetical protein IT292_01300 [Deltaproteobacteria bacterium]|nr:hypothetical protein [Deltaproteobacteria bacterium]
MGKEIVGSGETVLNLLLAARSGFLVGTTGGTVVNSTTNLAENPGALAIGLKSEAETQKEAMEGTAWAAAKATALSICPRLPVKMPLATAGQRVGIGAGIGSTIAGTSEYLSLSSAQEKLSQAFRDGGNNVCEEKKEAAVKSKTAATVLSGSQYEKYFAPIVEEYVDARIRLFSTASENTNVFNRQELNDEIRKTISVLFCSAENTYDENTRQNPAREKALQYVLDKTNLTDSDVTFRVARQSVRGAELSALYSYPSALSFAPKTIGKVPATLSKLVPVNTVSKGVLGTGVSALEGGFEFQANETIKAKVVENSDLLPLPFGSNEACK